jgi:Glycine transporter
MTGTALLSLDLAGAFAFALNGAMTGVKAAQLDIIGMLALGMVTALGGGILRDSLIGALPPATFSDWRYLAVAAAEGFPGRRRGDRGTKRDLADGRGGHLDAAGNAVRPAGLSPPR